MQHFSYCRHHDLCSFDTISIMMIEDYEPLHKYKKLTFGLHFIQYCGQQGSANYSSTVDLQIDDESLIFIHLISLSNHALGSDTLIACLDKQKITHVVPLEKPLDTILLNNNCYHAVTPLNSRNAIAIKNILLFTVEPGYMHIKEPTNEFTALTLRKSKNSTSH